MNYFFGLKNEIIKSELQIPLFQNRAPSNLDVRVYEAKVVAGKWKVEETKDFEKRNDFFILDNENISNEKIYFLATKKDLESFNSSELRILNKYTSTSPAYRCNFKVYIENGGFSSYQAEYPFGMTKVKGNILTPIGTLLNEKAEKNFLIFRNILSQPLNLKFDAFFVDVEQRKILKKINFQTNYTNFIEIENDLIRPQVYLVTKNFVGIPIYLSIDKEHLSFEHTHPPHAYFFGNDAYKNVKILKEKVNEIIN